MTFDAPFQENTRAKNLERLRNQTLDVLILGGGINGAGVARDLALRSRRTGANLTIGLVEKAYFASGTSGKNSHLIHGGLRYLKQLNIRLVKEALRERLILLEIAPHLVEPQPFLLPFYRRFDRAFYGLGLWTYDLLAGDAQVGYPPRYLSAAEVAAMEPGLERRNLAGGAVFYDCRVQASRFVLENIFDAALAGAIVANYTEASEVTGAGAVLTDVLTGERFPARARKIVDATGPWESNVRLVRGSHVLLPRLTASDAAISYFDKSGRIVFLIPWGELSLVGTTDVDHESGPDNVRITSDEIRYLLGTVRRLYPNADTRVISAFSSLRPLVQSGGSATKASREHRIWNGPNRVLHITGGKYTTYRAMSEEAADMVAREIAPPLLRQCTTAQTALAGNKPERLKELITCVPSIAALYALDPGELEPVTRVYGVQQANLLNLLPAKAAGGLSRMEIARIRFAVQHEMARRLLDVMFVSTYWGYERKWTGLELHPHAAVMAGLLGWDERRIGEEIALTEQIMDLPA